MKKTNLVLGLGVALLLSACSSDDGKPTPTPSESKSEYVLSVKSSAPSDKDKADYILTSEDISKGVLNLSGNGMEQDGTFRYYLTSKNKFYSFLYGRNQDGAVTAYGLNKKGELVQESDTKSETVQVFAPVNNDILMIKESRQANSKSATWYQYDTKTAQIVNEGNMNTEEIANKPNGEFAFFTWANQFGNDKVLLPFMTIKGIGWASAFDTDYPDEANVAIYSYPDMKLLKVITDNRISSIGRYMTNAISVDEKGDAYAFSPSTRSADLKNIKSTKPSGILRIKKGTMDFDNDYYFNIKEATNGEYYLSDKVYAKDGKMLGFFKKDGMISIFAPGSKLGIIDLYTKSITWVNGVPDSEQIKFSSGQQSYLSKDKNKIIVGVSTANGECYVYSIDVNSATATKGLQVKGGNVTAVSRLFSGS